MSHHDMSASSRVGEDSSENSDAASGALFPLEEASATVVLQELGTYTVVTADPPWTSVGQLVPEPARVVLATDMDVANLDRLASDEPEGGSIVGLGGGTALDTAKYIAWITNKPLVQIPTIASVDAAFTDAVGVRVDGHVRYRGSIVPDRVIVDIRLISSAPLRLNRAGIGDILSCHTALRDWDMASRAGVGEPYDLELVSLGRRLVSELSEASGDIKNMTPTGIRFLTNTYRAIGSACAEAGHSRFEEGAEHFLAYSYEFATGRHQIHGELVSMCVAAIALLQDNDADNVIDLIDRCGTTTHPADLAITKSEFVHALTSARAYVLDESLDYSILNTLEVTPSRATEVWEFISTGLPRVR